MATFNSGLWNGILFNGGTSTSAATLTTFTAKALIYRALRLLTVLRAGQTASPEQNGDGFDFLNDLLDAWNLDRLNLPSLRTDLFTLTADQAEYTLGSEGDFDAPRPERIEQAVIVSGGIRKAFNRLLTLEEWAARCEPGVYCNYAFPLAAIGINPAPVSSTDTLELTSWQLFTAFSDLDTEVSMPAGYALALRYNLADLMASAFVPHMKNTPLLSDVAAKARQYKGEIESHNAPAHVLRCDAAVLSRDHRHHILDC